MNQVSGNDRVDVGHTYFSQCKIHVRTSPITRMFSITLHTTIKNTTILSNILKKSLQKHLSYLNNELHLNDASTSKIENHNTNTGYETKLLKVAIIGEPNAGKSTLINNLMDRKVCPVSKKVHTTRKRSHAIITEHDTQIVFLDNPGLVSKSELKKYRLEKSFEKDSSKSLNEADVVGVVHDVSNTWTRERLDVKLIHLLQKFQRKPSFLVLNKIDALKSKRKLLDITRILTQNCINSIPYAYDNMKTVNKNIGWPQFREIFMVSALTGDGIENIKTYLLNNAKPSDWMYPANIWTENTFDDVIVRTVQATLLDFLPQEIPYKLKTQMELFEVSDTGKIHAVVLVECPHDRIQKLVVGVGDGKLRQITEKAQKDLLHTFDQPVRLHIIVNVAKNKDV